MQHQQQQLLNINNKISIYSDDSRRNSRSSGHGRTCSDKIFQQKLKVMIKEKYNCFHRKEFRRKRRCCVVAVAAWAVQLSRTLHFLSTSFLFSLVLRNYFVGISFIFPRSRNTATPLAYTRTLNKNNTRKIKIKHFLFFIFKKQSIEL